MRRFLKSFSSDLSKLLEGDEYLPCCDEKEMTLCKEPLRLVLREKEQWIFKKPSYTYEFTEFSLRDILVPSDTESGGFTSSIVGDHDLFTDVRRLECCSQTSISSFSHVDPSMDFSTFSSKSARPVVDLKFKEIKKLEGIVDELHRQWRFKKDHRLWQRITDTTKKCELCLITGVVFAKTDVTIRLRQRGTGELQKLLKKLRDIHQKYWRKRMRLPPIRKGKALAYKVRSLQVHPTDGRISLPMVSMSHSGDPVMALFSIDPEKEINDCRLYYSKYFGQLSNEKQGLFREAAKKVLCMAVAKSDLAQWRDTDEGVDGRSLSNEKQGLFREAAKNILDMAVTKSDLAQWRDTDEGVDGRSSGSEPCRFLFELLMKTTGALPTTDKPKEKEWADLLQEMGAQGLFDLSERRDAMYGIRYFVTALFCLPPEALPLLRDCANESENHKVLQVVTQLELLLRCVVEWEEYSVIEDIPNVNTFLSLALLEDEEGFLYSWRAAYVSAIYLCGLP